MVPKFANPHLLSQDVEPTTRLEIAERAGFTSIVHDEENRLKRNLDTLLRDVWADALAETSCLSRTKRQRVTEGHKDGSGQLGKDSSHRATLVLEHPVAFRLVSSMKHPQYVSLDPKPSSLPASRGPDCEDDEMQAETRKTRSLSVAVEFESLIKAAVPTRQVNPKSVAVGAKVALNTALACPLPPLLVTEEIRARKTVWRFKTRKRQENPAVSPHEPRLSCIVLPVTSVSDKKEMPRKKRRKHVRERPPPAYWRPLPDLRGKCMGYGLGYPSTWTPDQRYVRDTMKKGVEST